MADVDLKTRLFQSAHEMKKFRMGKLCPHVSQAEFFALEQIGRAMEHDPEGILVSVLAKKLKIAPPTTSRCLKSLEEKGLIIREINAADRRNIHVKLTEDGQKIKLHMIGVMDEFLDTVVNRLGDEKTETLIGLIKEITGIMEEELKKRERDLT